MTFLTASVGTFAFAYIFYIIFIVIVRLVLPTVLIVLLIKALIKYLRTKEVRQEKAIARKSLGEVLKEHRVRCHMTQEFVAEHLGVSRQAVSKWENGSADPSTSNLLALAKLYNIDATDLLRTVTSQSK